MRRLVIALAALATSAAAPPQANQDIIVTGRKLSSHEVSRAVGSISRPEATGGFEAQYPRWADRICVAVAGFPRDDAEYIADRIGAVARDLKLEAGQPGCLPNIFILATEDPAKLIKGLRLKRTGLLDGREASVVRRIQDSHDAVRWIGATAMRGSLGEPPHDSDSGANGRSIPTINSYNGGSRLVATTQMFLARETIVVDIRQIDGLSYGQLADYLALVSLAQLNPHASAPGVDTILSLFPRGGTAPAGLTAFDKAYLAGLYRSTPNSVGAMQKSQIEGTILKTMRTPAAALPPDA
jgi:hypothetical protein